MTQSIINLESISYEAIRADLLNYAKTANADKPKFRNFYENGAGVTLIDLIAGLGTFSAYTSAANRRETYLGRAVLGTSITEISATVGYPINRPKATRLKIEFTTSDPFEWSREEQFGTYDISHKIISLLADEEFPVNENEVIVAVGEWDEYVVTSNTSENFYKILVADEIDNDLVEVTVDDVPVEMTRFPEDLTPNTILQKSFSFGTYFIFGDGVLGKKITAGNEVKIKYLRPTAPDFNSIISNDLIKLEKGTVTSVEVAEYGSNIDSTNKLRAIAAGYYRARRRLVTLTDYKYIAMSYPGIISAYAKKKDFECCTVQLSCVTESGSLMTQIERSNLLEYLDEFKMLGTSIELVDPNAIYVDVSMVVVVTNNAVIGEISDQIKAYFNSMTNELGRIFIVNGVLNLDIKDVKRTYLKYPIKDYKAAANQYFVIRSFDIQFTDNDFLVGSMGTDLNKGYTFNV